MAYPNKLWVWGYVAPDRVPTSSIAFVKRSVWCSMESGAEYLQARRAVFMDSTSDRNRLCDRYFQYVAGMDEVICGLEHGHYAETARMVSEFSLSHPNVRGAVIDDFLDEVGPSQSMTVDALREIYENLKSVNHALKLYVVRYSRQNMDDIMPYLPYIDVINFWVWISTDHYWRYQYEQDILTMTRKYRKPILQGFFLHDYGDSGGAQPMEMVKLQIPRMARELLRGRVEGIVVLQPGWFAEEDHREQIQWVKNYFDWFHGVHTFRGEQS